MFSDFDRSSLLGDITTFINAGLYDYDLFLDFIQTLGQGRSLAMWGSAQSTILDLLDHLFATEAQNKLKVIPDGAEAF